MNETLFKISVVVFCIVRVCVHYICALANGFCGKKVPPVNDPVLLLSATELAKRIREGTVSSASVVQAYIDRINEVEPYINATVDRRFEDALEEAREVDTLVASRNMTIEQLENEKPLLGVPFTVKILITVKGLRSTAGSLLFKDVRSEKDGVCVALMKEAGAIILATTNSAECGMHLQTSNYIHGTTRNPYDTRRTSGGSSGGESALIGASGSVIGLGNDLGGSIRVPCSFTGIFGHKPSRGLVSNEGTFPIPDPNLQYLLSTGPMCRYAEDLVTVMRVLSVPNETGKQFGKQVNFQKLKVYYLYSFGENIPFIENVETEIKDTIRKVVSHFQKKGSKTEEVSIPLFRQSSSIFFHALFSSVADVGKTLSFGKVELNPFQELLKYICFRSIFTIGYVSALIGKHTPVYNPEKIDYYKKLEIKLDYQLSALLDENSVLFVPTMPFPAPYYNEIGILVGSCGYTSIFNVLGLPVTQCPIGLNKQGLPMGIQIVGRRGNDPLTVSCALEIEKALGGWRTPYSKS